MVLLLFATGLTLVGVRRSFPNLFRIFRDSHGGTNLPLEEIPSPLLAGKVSKDGLKTKHFPPTKGTVLLWAILVGGVVSLVVRIELFRRILKATECTVSSFEVHNYLGNPRLV